MADALELPAPWGLQFPLRDPATGKEAQLQPHLLLKHTQLLRRLHELQPNLAFKEKQLREAIAMLIKRHPDWRLDDKQKKEMQDIVSQRVFAMTRQVGTTARRPKKPPWFTATVVPLERLPTIADDGLETESATASNIKWQFDWNAEIRETSKAWRCRTTSPKAKEYTDLLTPGASALDPVVATFADAMKREIPEFLTAALEAKQIVASKKRVHVTLESPSGAPIVVKDRVDRNKLPLISLFLSSKRVCQIVPLEPEHVEPMSQVAKVSSNV